MQESYFQYRTDLAQTDCVFQCPETCDAPGCRAPDVIVEVTIFDLIRLSQVLDASVSSLFSNHCCLGLQNIEINPRYKRLILKLVKPCHFLQKTTCIVHDSKPLNCVLFPEYHQIKDLLSTWTAYSVHSKFPCLNDDIVISDERRRTLKKLRRLSKIEEAVSCYFLFGVSSFIIDSKPLNRQLKRNNPKKAAISPQDYDKLFIKTLQRIGFFNFIMDNVLKLDTYSGIENVFKTLDQDAFVKSLLEQTIRPKTIQTFKGKQIRQQRKYLGPRALTAMVF